MKKLLKRITTSGLLATITIGDHTIEIPLPAVFDSPQGLILEAKDIINILIALGSVIAVGMIIVSGYTLMTSTGDPDKVEQGQKTLTGAVVGLLIVWAAGLIIKFVVDMMAA